MSCAIVNVILKIYSTRFMNSRVFGRMICILPTILLYSACRRKLDIATCLVAVYSAGLCSNANLYIYIYIHCISNAAYAFDGTLHGRHICIGFKFNLFETSEFQMRLKQEQVSVIGYYLRIANPLVFTGVHSLQDLAQKAIHLCSLLS